MDEKSSSEPSSPRSISDEANAHFKIGMEQKAAGQNDAALTSFRRAAILDAGFFAAHLQIGLLCREKAKYDKMFQRYAFEAFRSAARLNLNSEEAHNHYIMAGQQMGQLDSLHQEYSNWARQNPSNALLQQCNKNIVTISMAMIPQQVGITGSGTAGSLRKVFLLISLATLAAGLLCIVVPPVLFKSRKISREQVRGFLRVGSMLGVAGVVGFIVRSRLD